MTQAAANTVEEEIVCAHLYTIYPQSTIQRGDKDTVWMKCKYQNLSDKTSFNATGYNLPESKRTNYVLRGKWKRDQKYGLSFEVESFDVILPTGEDGVVSYLSSLKVRIGKGKAKSIYATFGDSIWQILESSPNDLLKVPGITPAIIKNLNLKLAETKVERELRKLFSGTFQISARKISNAKTYLGVEAADMIRQNPYLLCKIPGFTFSEVDKLGCKLGIPANEPSRLLGAIPCVFQDAAQSGHSCLPKEQYLSLYLNLLNTSAMNTSVRREEATAAINDACQKKIITSNAGMLYSRFRYEQEVLITECLMRMLSSKPQSSGVTEKIDEYEKESNMTLSPAQRDAVKMVFDNNVSIITGGPGTGKTTVIRAVLSVYMKAFGTRSDIVCLAPTGRAARRMEETTGIPACTIHSAVGYTGEVKTHFSDEDAAPMSGKLFVIDETSMMDMFITSILIQKIPSDARVVFVGDPEQLPSVGCGNVLADLIRSTCVPTTKLNVIFRQASQNPIVLNSGKIREGDTELLYTNTFKLMEEQTTAGVFARACEMYYRSVKAYGIDNVVLLCPYRSKSEINVDLFNRNLQHMINPPKTGELTIEKTGRVTFRVGDRVMQTKNTEDAKNGDIGEIKGIIEEDDPEDPTYKVKFAMIEFNRDGNLRKYNWDQCQDLDLAYSMSVHKSQGAEYKTVIFAISAQHHTLCRRNLLYTGITRAKENIALICEDVGVIHKAISNVSMDHRYTLLADRIWTKARFSSKI